MIRRGDIVLAALDPTVGNEQGKVRPVVIVSNDGVNSRADSLGAGVVTVVPLTSNVSRVFTFQVLLSADTHGLDRDSKAQAEQVRSISVTRLVRTVGRVAPQQLAALDDALRLHLQL